MKKELLVVAKKIRKLLEKVGHKAGYSSDLIGLCGLAAYLLAQKLDCKIVRVEGGEWDHCYCVAGDHCIDLTATQFGRWHKRVETFETSLWGAIHCQEYWEKGEILSPEDWARELVKWDGYNLDILDEDDWDEFERI